MHGPAALQLTQDGRLRHLLTTEGLPKSLITELLDTAETFCRRKGSQLKKCPCSAEKLLLTCFSKIQHERVQRSILLHTV